MTTTIYGVKPADRWRGRADFYYTQNGMPCNPRDADIFLTVTGRDVNVSARWPYMSRGNYASPYCPERLHKDIIAFADQERIPSYLRFAIVTSVPLPESSARRYLDSMQELDERMPVAHSPEVLHSRIVRLPK